MPGRTAEAVADTIRPAESRLVGGDPRTTVRPIPVVFHIGPLQIHTYGIGLAITFWFAFRYFESRLRKAGYRWQWLTGVFLWVVVASIVGARLLHVVTNVSLYSHHLIDVFAVWHGGLSSFGGLLFGVPTGIILARRRCPELPTVRALDLVAPVLVAAWGLGRLLGPQLMVAGGGHPTQAWFGMYYAGQVGKRLPVPIFQAIDCFIIWGILILIERHVTKRPNGFVVCAALALWGLARFFEQHLWLGAEGIGSALVQVTGLVLFVAGGAAMAWLWWRRPHLATGAPAAIGDTATDASGDAGPPGPADATPLADDGEPVAPDAAPAGRSPAGDGPPTGAEPLTSGAPADAGD